MNGVYDIGEDFIDALNGVYDIGEDFTDALNGVYDAPEAFQDMYLDGIYTTAYCHSVVGYIAVCDSADNCHVSEQEECENYGYIWGAEPFTDLNNNGLWDEGEDFTDIPNGISDEGDNFTDALNGIWNDGEEFIDALNGVFDEGDEFVDGGNGV